MVSPFTPVAERGGKSPVGFSLTTEQSSFSIVTLPVVQGADTSVKKPLNSATVGARPSNVGCVLCLTGSKVSTSLPETS